MRWALRKSWMSFSSPAPGHVPHHRIDSVLSHRRHCACIALVFIRMNGFCPLRRWSAVGRRLVCPRRENPGWTSTNAAEARPECRPSLCATARGVRVRRRTALQAERESSAVKVWAKVVMIELAPHPLEDLLSIVSPRQAEALLTHAPGCGFRGPRGRTLALRISRRSPPNKHSRSGPHLGANFTIVKVALLDLSPSRSNAPLDPFLAAVRDSARSPGISLRAAPV